MWCLATHRVTVIQKGGLQSASWWKGHLPEHVLFTYWGQLNKNSFPLSSHLLPPHPSISDNPVAPWPDVESDRSYNALRAGTSSTWQLNTHSNQKNRMSCPVTQPRKVPAPLRTSLTLPGVPSWPRVLQRGQAPPQPLMYGRRNLPWAECASFLRSAQVMGTQSNAIKAQQLNKAAPVSWASKPTSGRAFMFLPEACYGKGHAGKDAAFTPGLLGSSSPLCSMSPSHFSWQIQIWECSCLLSWKKKKK